MLNYINEAFKQLDLLTESVFDTSEDSLTDLATFVNNDDEVEQITVINDEFDNEDNIPDPKVGDLILNCNICHSLMFKNKDDITIDENGEVNKDYPCPRCGETDGYTIVGEIQEFKPESEEEVEPIADEIPIEKSNEESNKEITESLKEGFFITDWKSTVIDLENGPKPSFNDSQWRQNAYNLYRQVMTDSEMSYLDDFAFMTGIEFEDDDEEESYIERVQNEIFYPIADADQALSKLRSEHPKLFEAAKKWMIEMIEDEPELVASGKGIIEFEHGDDEEEDIDESLNEATGKTPWDIIVAAYPELNTISENLTEGFNNVSIETETDRMTMTSEDNGKVTVTTEPITNDTIAEEGAVIAPVSDETQDAIISANAEIETEETPDEDEMMDFDFDEVDETSFDKLGESYLKRVYENVDSFKTTKVSTTDNQLIVEGLISFKSGVKKNTGFIFEAKDATKEGRLRFVGENKHFSRGNKAFTLVGSMNESKKFICESFTYNYRAKTPAGKATRVYGTVSYKK